MAPLKQILQNLRWYQWLLAALVLVYLIYIALSYLYLPGKLQAVVQKDVAELIGRDIRVQRIAYDPFGLALEVDGFSIADRPDQPLLAWQRFYVNVELWKSLFGWQLRLSRVDLEQPRINIERRKDDFNFTSILERFPAEEPDPAAEPSEKQAFALQVDDINIKEGTFTLDDVSGTKPAHSTLDQITLGVHNLYLATGDDKLNPFNLQAEMPGGGTLTLGGQYRADPLLVQSDVALKGLVLSKFADFVENAIPMRVNDGTLNLNAKVELEQQDAFEARVKQGSVSLQNLALDDEQPEPPLARVQQLDVTGIEFDLVKQSVVINRVVLDGFQVNQWLKDGGEVRYQHLLVEKTVEANVAADQPATAENPWSLLIKETRFQNGTASFTDLSNGLNASQSIKDIGLTLNDITLEEGTTIPLEINANINNGGALNVKGQIVLVPFAADLHYTLNALSLQPFNPYVEAHSWLQLQKGSLSVDGDVKLETSDPMPLTLNLNASLADVQAKDTRNGKKILAWKALDVKQVQLDLLQRNVTVDTVEWQQPDIAAEMGSDKQMNLATLAKTPETQTMATPTNADAAQTAEKEKPFQVSINTVSIKNGTTRMRDESITPAFKTGLYNLDMQVKHITTDGPQPATFTLASKIDKYAPFEAKGTLVPLNKQPGFAFTSQLRGLEMPNLSPYSGTYIGYQLRSGKLSLDLDYALKQRHLKGKNEIVARQLYLGDTVASDQAVNAPVSLGLALLRDVSGVIDLNVGVEGDIDDPGFSVAGLVFKALMNILVKAAASPFQLLGSLVGGGEDLGKLEFASGSSELSPDEQTKLSQLVQALSQRKELAVDIRGNASAEADGDALRQLRVRDNIARARKIAPAELPLDTLLDDEDNRDELDDLNDALSLPDAGDREDALVAADASLKGQDLTARVYQQMLQDVASRQSVTDQDLLALADQRALAIKQFLVETASLDHARTHMAKTTLAQLTGRICELGLVAE